MDDVPKGTESKETRQKRENQQERHERKQSEKRRKNVLWVVRVFVITLVMAVIFQLATESVVETGNLLFSFIILFLLIIVSILFDMIGTAAASAEIEPFMSRASRKDKRAVVAVRLLKNAERVTSFCNDIVGDICGIVAGGACSAIVIVISKDFGANTFVLSVVFSAIISALTVGGKAIGKIFGINKSHEIIMAVASLISVFSK